MLHIQPVTLKRMVRVKVRYQFETELLWLFFSTSTLTQCHNIMQFNSVNLCVSHINVTLMIVCRAAKREPAMFDFNIPSLYHHHFLNIFSASWYHKIGKFIKGRKENMVVISPIVTKVLHGLAPGGWINFTGTKLQWIKQVQTYIYTHRYMNDHTGIWTGKYLLHTKK